MDLDGVARDLVPPAVEMLLQSPAKNVISALQSGGSTIHGVLETLSKKEESIS